MDLTRRIAVPLVALALAATACTSDDEADPPARASSPTATGSASATPSPDPVTWSSRGTSCAEGGGPMLISDEVRFSRPVTVTGMRPVGATVGIQVGRITISRVPRGTIPVGGAWRSGRPAATWRDDLAWADRQPIAGAHLDAGRYYFFLPVSVGSLPSWYDGFALSWNDGTTRGSSTWRAHDAYRENCR